MVKNITIENSYQLYEFRLACYYKRKYGKIKNEQFEYLLLQDNEKRAYCSVWIMYGVIIDSFLNHVGLKEFDVPKLTLNDYCILNSMIKEMFSK